MEFLIHSLDYQQLLSLLGNGDDIRFDFLKLNVTNKPFDNKSLLLSTDQVESITDALSNLIVEKGVSNGEINSFGLKLESLINKLTNHLTD